MSRTEPRNNAARGCAGRSSPRAVTKPLLTRLRAARQLLRDWERACFAGDPNLQDPDSAVAHEVARFRQADGALREVIRQLAGPTNVADRRPARRSTRTTREQA